jgi:hypothetical protein
VSVKVVKIVTRKTATRDILTLKTADDDRLYGFRHGPFPCSTCEDCGAVVLRGWFAHHAKWHRERGS